MRRMWMLGALLWAMCGCTSFKMPCYELPNPAPLPPADPDRVWNEIVDVIDDDFEIQREVRPRRVGDLLTEGRIDTTPEVSATTFEPWRHDVGNRRERIESTLQTIRRTALVRVVPDGQGYMIDVAVYKELEDAPSMFAPTAEATFRADTSLTRYDESITAQPATEGWIPMGRDTALEQKIIAKITSRLNAPIYGPGGPPLAPPHPLMQ